MANHATKVTTMGTHPLPTFLKDRLTVRFNRSQFRYLKSKPNAAKHVRDLVDLDMKVGVENDRL